VPRLSERYFSGLASLRSTRQSVFGSGRLGTFSGGHAHRFRDAFATELHEQVSVLLGHSSIRITETHYRPWVRDRQRQLEVNLEPAWGQDQIGSLEAGKSRDIRREAETIHWRLELSSEKIETLRAHSALLRCAANWTGIAKKKCKQIPGDFRSRELTEVTRRLRRGTKVS
jgi:hypothetical protein